jgi:nucleoid-associated protein YgaU
VRPAGKQELLAIPEQPAVQREYERHEQAPERPAADHPEAPSSERGKGKLIFAGIAAVLLAALFFSGIFNRSITVQKEQGSKTKKAVVEKPKPAVKPPVRKPAPVEPPKPVAAEGPLVAFSGSSVYVVKKGDTLWAISKRFTGNPFNYPQVAKENNIKNPDLIFPGQEIRL